MVFVEGIQVVFSDRIGGSEALYELCGGCFLLLVEHLGISLQLFCFLESYGQVVVNGFLLLFQLELQFFCLL